MLNFGNPKMLCLFCLMRQPGLDGRTRTWADQDWIGPMVFKNLRIRTGSDSIFADQDWTRAEQFHSPFMSAGYLQFFFGSGFDLDIYFVFNWIRIFV